MPTSEFKGSRKTMPWQVYGPGLSSSLLEFLLNNTDTSVFHSYYTSLLPFLHSLQPEYFIDVTNVIELYETDILI
jgi:hypothetical protein